MQKIAQTVTEKQNKTIFNKNTNLQFLVILLLYKNKMFIPCPIFFLNSPPPKKTKKTNNTKKNQKYKNTKTLHKTSSHPPYLSPSSSSSWYCPTPYEFSKTIPFPPSFISCNVPIRTKTFTIDSDPEFHYHQHSTPAHPFSSPLPDPHLLRISTTINPS